MDCIINILITAGTSLSIGAGISLSLFKFFGQGWVKNWFEKDIKTYENELAFNIFQKQTQFKNTYERQAVIIESIYSKSVSIHELVKSVNDASNIEDYRFNMENFNVEELEKQIHELNHFYNLNRIYIGKPLADSINNFINLFEDKICDFYNVSNVLDPPNDNTREIFIQNILESEWDDLFTKLINEFQNIIGIR